MRLFDSFVRFDDMLIDKVFNPIAEWLFSHLGINNFSTARYVCFIASGFTLYETWYNVRRLALTDAVTDLIVLTVLVALIRVNTRTLVSPPGTASPFRFSYFSRFTLIILNIIIIGFMNPRIPTTVISLLFTVIGYFMACDTPKGDRLKAFKSEPV